MIHFICTNKITVWARELWILFFLKTPISILIGIVSMIWLKRTRLFFWYFKRFLLELIWQTLKSREVMLIHLCYLWTKYVQLYPRLLSSEHKHEQRAVFSHFRSCLYASEVLDVTSSQYIHGLKYFILNEALLVVKSYAALIKYNFRKFIFHV